MPAYSILIGEVGYGTEKETALAERNGFNRFVIYDTLCWKGEVLKNETNIHRFKFIESVFSKSKYADMTSQDSPIQLARTIPLEGTPESNQSRAFRMFDNIVYEGGEGVVLKEYEGKYVVQGESTSMYKIKKFMTKDYVCMGFTR